MCCLLMLLQHIKADVNSTQSVKKLHVHRQRENIIRRFVKINEHTNKQTNKYIYVCFCACSVDMKCLHVLAMLINAMAILGFQ